MSDSNSSLTIRVGVSGVAAALGDIKNLAGGIAGAFSFITAEFDPSKIVDSIKGVLQFGSTLKQIHDRTGDSVASLTSLDEALTRIGGSAESASMMISKMQKTVSEAASGAAPAAIKAFSVLGLDPKELAQLSTDKQLLDIAKALDAVANADQRAQLAMDIFGKSGAQMLSLFKDGKAMDMLAKGAGEFGQVMQRNAADFQDAIFDFNQIGYIGKKFWAGFLDLIPVHEITESITGSLESVNFVGFGQKAGALVTVVINSWKDGKFPEMLGLLIEAGFEIGVDAVKSLWLSTWQALTGATAGQIYLSLINAIMSFGVGAAKFLIKVLSEPIIYMAAGFDWLGSHLKEIFTDSINYFIEQWDKFVSFASGKKGNIIQPLDKRGSDTFSESLADMRKFIEPLFSGSTDFLTQSLQQSQEILGVNQKLSGVDNARMTATQRLNALVQEQIKLRQSVKTEETNEQGQLVKVMSIQQIAASEEILMKKGLLAIDQKLAQVEGDYTKTAAQKYAEEKKLLDEKIAGLELVISLNNKLIQSPSTSDTDRNLLLQRNQGFETQLVGAQDKSSKMGPDPQSFSQQFKAVFTELRGQSDAWAQNVAKSFEDVFNGAISSISSGITGLIMGTKTWGQALMQIGNTILTDIVQAIVQMGTRWVLTRLLMSTASKAAAAADTATLVPIAAAQAAIWSPAATLSTIATFGASAVAAPGFIAFAEGMTAMQSTLGSFAGGGYTGDGGMYDVAGFVHRGEVVFSQQDVARNGGVASVENMRRGGSAQQKFYIHMPPSDNAVLKVIRENPEAKHLIVDLVQKQVRFA